MRALDLFAGMGGASLGIEQTGLFGTVEAIEHDECTAWLHEHVLPESPVLRADIAGLEPKRWRRKPDLLWASPPCQPFTFQAQRSGWVDRRSALIEQVPRWVKALRPTFVVCEQVRLALPWWEQFAADFRQMGYSTWTGLLGAEQFGVPQSRTRAYLIASLESVAAPPAPTHRRFAARRSNGLDPVDDHLPIWRSASDAIDFDEDWQVIVTGRNRDQERELRYPAPTLTTGSHSFRLRPPKWSSNPARRGLTVREGLRLQGFPPETLDGLEIAKTAAYKGIGNSVSPPVARAIVNKMAGDCCADGGVATTVTSPPDHTT